MSEVVGRGCEQLWYKSSKPITGQKRVVEKERSHQEKRRTLFKNQIIPSTSITFYANGYLDLVSWHDIGRHDPPIMNNYSENQIRAFIDKADTNVVQLPHFPCHT